jgi:hypothetical protein
MFFTPFLNLPGGYHGAQSAPTVSTISSFSCAICIMTGGSPCSPRSAAGEISVLILLVPYAFDFVSSGDDRPRRNKTPNSAVSLMECA